MSDLTPCNYCSLGRMKARANKDGNAVTLLRGMREKDGTPIRGDGMAVYKYPKGTEFKKLDAASREKYFAVWMQEIPMHCMC